MLVTLLAWMAAPADASAQAPAQALPWPPTSDFTALGRQAQWLIEQHPTTLAQAEAAQAAGRFAAGARDIPALGVGQPPVWMHLRVHNTAATTESAHFVLRAMWMEHVDIHVLQDGQLLQHWQRDGAQPIAHALEPGLGITVPLQLPPGDSDIFARFETPETMVLPVYLLDDATLDDARRLVHYGFGLMYGLLFVLLAYNAMVGLALREPDYFYYALYLFSMLALNITFNGFGEAWLWPGAAQWQRVAAPVLLLFKASCGLLFACHFFRLSRASPRLLRGVLALGSLGMAVVVAATLQGAEAFATLLAREGMLGAALVMLALGVVQLRRRETAATLYTLGVAAGVGGMLVTALTLRGALEVTLPHYHATGIGSMLEATLLGLALVARMRLGRKAHRQAEHMAMRDPLTGLWNRRGFADIAERIWSGTPAQQQPLSLVVLDIDHFKRINDLHGHDTGDRVLVALAKSLTQHCRHGDEVARWGGEEFIVLLPGTHLAQAVGLAERLRQAVGQLDLRAGGTPLPLTVSLGVAERRPHQRLEALITEADMLLYRAKRQGRNRVEHTLAAPP